MAIWDWLFGSNTPTTSGTGSWGDLQSQMANYQYDPNDPNAWQRMQDQASTYAGQNANLGTGGTVGTAAKGIADLLSKQAGNLQQKDNPAPAAQAIRLQTPQVSSTMSTGHGDALSTLATLLAAKRNLGGIRGLLG